VINRKLFDDFVFVLASDNHSSRRARVHLRRLLIVHDGAT